MSQCHILSQSATLLQKRQISLTISHFAVECPRSFYTFHSLMPFFLYSATSKINVTSIQKSRISDHISSCCTRIVLYSPYTEQNFQSRVPHYYRNAVSLTISPFAVQCHFLSIQYHTYNQSATVLQKTYISLTTSHLAVQCHNLLMEYHTFSQSATLLQKSHLSDHIPSCCRVPDSSYIVPHLRQPHHHYYSAISPPEFHILTPHPYHTVHVNHPLPHYHYSATLIYKQPHLSQCHITVRVPHIDTCTSISQCQKLGVMDVSIGSRGRKEGKNEEEERE